MSDPTLNDALNPVEIGGMSILDHLNDLRIRLTWAFACLVVGTIVSFFWTSPLLEYLISLAGPAVERLETLGPADGIQTFFRVSLVSGAILAMPGILLNLWWFIEPGLEKREKRYVYVFVFSAFFLFSLGVAFVLFVLLPTALSFLAAFEDGNFQTSWTADLYVGFVTGFIFWIGVAFELPIVIYFVSRAGLVSPTVLREQWRIAIVAIAVIAAAITPTVDPVTMLLTMAPLSFLYLLSIGLAAIGERQFNKAHEF